MIHRQKHVDDHRDSEEGNRNGNDDDQTSIRFDLAALNRPIDDVVTPERQ
jgi:hypothetical protein